MDNFSGHVYLGDPSCGAPARTVPKRVRQEWKMLASSLPKYGIAVRACSENLQLLKAVISGPRFTPYYRGVCAPGRGRRADPTPGAPDGGGPAADSSS